MVLTYNGQTDYTNMITFTGVPNIITITPDYISGSKAKLELAINKLSDIDVDKQYYITINDVTITSNKKIPGNKEFYITNNDAKISTVVNSIVNALRDSGLVNYNIYQSLNLGNSVIIEAKEKGSMFNIKYNYNLPSITSSLVPGLTNDEFKGSLFYIDIMLDNKYLTTISKSYYKDYIDFNMSGILKSIAKYDKLTPYSLLIYNRKGTDIKAIKTITSKVTPGYICNQGKNFINTYPTIALNFSRGSLKRFINKTTLYTYLPLIPFRMYSNSASHTVMISYLSEAMGEIFGETLTIPTTGGICEKNILLNLNYFDGASFIDLRVSGVGTIRYKIIKDVDSTSRCQRVYYHNSYGGISFFDFTGLITENHKVDNETYTKNIYDYYKTGTKEQVKIYDKQTSIVVTLKSHLMERDAVWQFNDLLSSQDVWTNINGQDYKIIITDCKVDETETGVWEATVTYTYSLV